jgi:hypothetical protein
VIAEPVLRDEDGAPETVYVTRRQATDDGWLVPSLDVGSWRPLAVGDLVVALDRDSPDEFLVEVTEVVSTGDEVFYSLRHLADLDPAFEPGLDATRSWLAES